MLQQEMAGLRCLSCEHDNQAGAKFCVQCGSRLNLKLCGSCEAINDAGAERCHNCGGGFPVASASARSVGARSVDRLEAVPNTTDSPGKSLRGYRADSSPDRPSPGRSPRVRALLTALLVAAVGGVVSYYHHESRVEPAAPDHAKAPATEEAAVAPDTETPEVQPPAIATKPTHETAAPEPEPITQTVSPSQGDVTHTAGAAVAVSGASSEVKTAPLVNPAGGPSPVTHTKGFVAPRIVPDSEVQQAVAAHVDAGQTAVAGETSKRDPAVDIKQDQPRPGACSEGVTALGLCD